MAADQAGEMSPLEILIQFLFVIVAGSDTTRGALAVQTAQLLQHREQWEAVGSSGKQCASSLELLSSLRAAAVGGVGRCSEGSAPRNCGLFKKRRLKPHIFLHIVDGERGTLPG